MPKVERPKLTNRGAAGLLTKKTGTTTAQQPAKVVTALSGPELWAQAPKDRIIGQLEALTVDITTLSQDSENARLHPERNMASIKDSLCIYGQCKPVVVQRWSERKQAENVIIAGNGTHAAATELGWTKIAALITDMSDVEAAGYGLADNRTAELAKWDFEVVARHDKILLEAGHANVGWSQDELEVLRMADWTPPPIEDTSFGAEGGEGGVEPLLVSFTPDQYEVVGQAIAKMREGDPTMKEADQAEALVGICDLYLIHVNDRDAEDNSGSLFDAPSAEEN